MSVTQAFSQMMVQDRLTFQATILSDGEIEQIQRTLYQTANDLDDVPHENVQQYLQALNLIRSLNQAIADSYQSAEAGAAVHSLMQSVATMTATIQNYRGGPKATRDLRHKATILERNVQNTSNNASLDTHTRFMLRKSLQQMRKANISTPDIRKAIIHRVVKRTTPVVRAQAVNDVAATITPSLNNRILNRLAAKSDNHTASITENLKQSTSIKGQSASTSVVPSTQANTLPPGVNSTTAEPTTGKKLGSAKSVSTTNPSFPVENSALGTTQNTQRTSARSSATSMPRHSLTIGKTETPIRFEIRNTFRSAATTSTGIILSVLQGGLTTPSKTTTTATANTSLNAKAPASQTSLSLVVLQENTPEQRVSPTTVPATTPTAQTPLPPALSTAAQTAAPHTLATTPTIVTNQAVVAPAQLGFSSSQEIGQLHTLSPHTAPAQAAIPPTLSTIAPAAVPQPVTIPTIDVPLQASAQPLPIHAHVSEPTTAIAPMSEPPRIVERNVETTPVAVDTKTFLEPVTVVTSVTSDSTPAVQTIDVTPSNTPHHVDTHVVVPPESFHQENVQPMEQAPPPENQQNHQKASEWDAAKSECTGCSGSKGCCGPQAPDIHETPIVDTATQALATADPSTQRVAQSAPSAEIVTKVDVVAESTKATENYPSSLPVEIRLQNVNEQIVAFKEQHGDSYKGAEGYKALSDQRADLLKEKRENDKKAEATRPGGCAACGAGCATKTCG